jgi:hypothetical protein
MRLVEKPHLSILFEHFMMKKTGVLFSAGWTHSE